MTFYYYEQRNRKCKQCLNIIFINVSTVASSVVGALVGNMTHFDTLFLVSQSF